MVGDRLKGIRKPKIPDGFLQLLIVLHELVDIRIQAGDLFGQFVIEVAAHIIEGLLLHQGLAVGIALVDGLVVDVDLLLVILLGHRTSGSLLKGKVILQGTADPGEVVDGILKFLPLCLQHLLGVVRDLLLGVVPFVGIPLDGPGPYLPVQLL